MEARGGICATVMPQKAQDLKGILREVERQRPDYLELRVDRLPVHEIAPALEKLDRKTMRKTVLTLRSIEEGGHYSGNEGERRIILNYLCTREPMLLDIEEQFASRNRIFVEAIKSTGVGTLISYHNFYTTPIPRVMDNLRKEMLEIGDVAKIVTTAKEVMDNFRIFKLYGLAKGDGGGRLLSFAMGEYGQISRIMSITHYGAPFAYCSLGRPIAPGMLSVREMREIIRHVP